MKDVLMSMSQRLPFVPRVLVALMSIVLMLSMGVAYAGADDREPVETGTLDAPEGAAIEPLNTGSPVTLAGSGFAPGGEVEVAIESDPVVLATVPADAAGSFEVAVTIPERLPSGVHVLKATGPSATGGLLVLSLSVGIAARASMALLGALPTTGADPLPSAALAVGAAAADGL